MKNKNEESHPYSHGDDYCVVIEAKASWFRLPFRDIWEYRDLLFLMVRRDFVAKYKQTVLGPLWFIIQPLMMTMVFTVVFNRIGKIPTDKLPPMLFYLCGQLSWSYFAQCMNGTSRTFVANANLFGKVFFPRLIIPLSVVASSLIAFVIQLATFMAFWVFFKFFTPAGELFGFTPYLLALPVLLIITGAIGLGVGLWMSSMSAKYRDFAHLGTFLTQLWMYATPVVYPLSEVPEKWRWVVSLNPMTGIVETYRYAFLGAGTVEAKFLLISAASAIVLLITGVLMFGKTERTFIDTV